MSYSGLIPDFGGVVTTDFYAALSAFSVREGLDADAFVRTIRETPEGRRALAAVECGQLSQREYEQVIGRLLGLDDQGLLARALADLRPRPEILEVVRRSRAAGVRVAALSNSWGTGDGPDRHAGQAARSPQPYRRGLVVPGSGGLGRFIRTCVTSTSDKSPPGSN